MASSALLRAVALQLSKAGSATAAPAARLATATSLPETALASVAARLAAASSPPGSATAYLVEVYESAAARRAALSAISRGPAHDVADLVAMLEDSPAFSTASATGSLAGSTSACSSSTPAYVFEVYASETVLAALRASVASAARKGMDKAPLVVLEVATPTARASLRSASAAAAAGGADAPHPSSECAASPTTALSPSGSVLFAHYANEWVRASLGSNPSVAAAPDESGEDAPLVLVPTPSNARAAAHLPPYGPFVSPTSAVPRSRAYSTAAASTPPTTLEDMLNLLNNSSLTFAEQLIFRMNFYKTFRVEDVLHFLDGGEFTFQELLRIQKKINHVAGPHRDRLHLVAKEDITYTLRPEFEKKESPLMLHMNAKMDVVLKKLDAQGEAVKEASEVLSKTKKWGIVTIGGRDIDLSGIVGFIAKILFGSGQGVQDSGDKD